MAEIEIYNKTATGFSMRLIGLQGGDDILYDRQVMWYVNDVLRGTVKIAQGEITEANTSGGDLHISGLSTDTYYYVKCTVWKVVTGKEPEKIWTSGGEKIVSLGSPLSGTGVKDFSIWQKDLTEDDYQTACIKIRAEVDMSDTNFYVYDDILDDFYKLDVTWDSDTLIGTAEFGPINTMGEHKFELQYTYVINYALGYTVTFHNLYPPLVTGLSWKYTYRGLIFSWYTTGESDVLYQLRYWDDEAHEWVTLNDDYDVRSLPTNWDGNSYLECGKTYLFGVRTRYKGASSYSSYTTARVTIPPAIPTGKLLGGTNEMIIYQYGVKEPTYIDYLKVEIVDDARNFVYDTRYVYINSTDSVSPSGTLTFSDLSTSTYYVRCSAFRNGVQCYFEDGYLAYFESGNTQIRRTSKVVPWTWHIGIPTWQEGVLNDRELAYQALTNQGPVDNFKYRIFNELCAKVKEALEAYGTVWDTTFADYENTLMTVDDQVLTAVRFNSLRKNVGNQYSTDIEDKKPGDPVIGQEFITITDALNNFIRTKINV